MLENNDGQNLSAQDEAASSGLAGNDDKTQQEAGAQQSGEVAKQAAGAEQQSASEENARRGNETSGAVKEPATLKSVEYVTAGKAEDAAANRTGDSAASRSGESAAPAKRSQKDFLKEWTVDVLFCLMAAAVTAVAYHFFSNPNGFAPGGLTGLATMAAYLTELNMGWFMLMFNLPIFIAVSIFVNRKTGIMLCIYVALQSLFLLLLPKTGLPVYKTTNNLIYASIATGVISGFGFSLMLRRFGASGGTYAIASLLKRAHPESNVAWVSFAMDASVVFLAFFVYGRKVDPVIGTLLNLFIADVVVDYVLSGMKSGYKFQIVTDDPEGLAERLMKELGRGVTDIKAVGMYTHKEKNMLICIIRRRQLGEMMKILKSYPNVFASFEKVSEVFGRFVK